MTTITHLTVPFSFPKQTSKHRIGHGKATDSFPPFTKMADIGAKFVSQKINKLRWKNFVNNTLDGPDTFVTGSWDDEVFLF